MNRFAYVTLLSSDNYLPGVIGLFNSIRATSTPYPFLVIATRISQATLEVLSDLDIPVVEAYPINPPENVAKFNSSIGLGVWNNCFDKFHIMNFDIFDKIIYLDADMEVLSNIDELFQIDYPGFVRDPARYFQITDFKDYTVNNAGMIVVKPSIQIFKDLMNILDSYKNENVEEKNIIVSDQFIFDNYYRDSFEKTGFLDFSYNAFFPYLEFYKKENPAFSPKIIHYAGMDKPWMDTFDDLLSYKSPIALMYKAKLIAFSMNYGIFLRGLNLR